MALCVSDDRPVWKNNAVPVESNDGENVGPLDRATARITDGAVIFLAGSMRFGRSIAPFPGGMDAGTER